MRLIVGLGNPGEKYKLTRHNVGFMAVDALADKLGLTWQLNKKLAAEIARSDNLMLAKPSLWMNNSGQAVRRILAYYKLLPKKFGILTARDSDLSTSLTIIHDDLDIEFGQYKISVASRSAGHRGVQSAIDNLKTKNFTRIRIGVKNSGLKNVPADKFVLQKFNQTELPVINKIILEIINRMA